MGSNCDHFDFNMHLFFHQTTQGKLQDAQERLEVYERRNSDQVKLLAELTTKVKKKEGEHAFYSLFQLS